MDLIEELYCLVDENLPYRPGHRRLEEMEEALNETMGEKFMQEYMSISFEQDYRSRMDLFRCCFALGARLGNGLE